MTVVTYSLPLRERKKRDTRQRIVMAGLDAFTARGFENCTIDEIARAAGVGKGTVYDFRTKEDLVVSFMVDIERQMQAEAATLAQARGLVASILTRFIESQMALKAAHYPFVRLFLAQLAGRATPADTWVGEASTALDPPLVQLFGKLQKRGLVRRDVDVPTLVGTFKVMQLGLMVLWAIEGPPWTGIGEIVRQQVRLFCSGLEGEAMTTLAVAVACWIALTLWEWLELRFSGLVPLSTGLTVGIVYVVAMASGTRGWPLFRLLLQLSAGVNVLDIQNREPGPVTIPPGEIAADDGRRMLVQRRACRRHSPGGPRVTCVGRPSNGDGGLSETVVEAAGARHPLHRAVSDRRFAHSPLHQRVLRQEQRDRDALVRRAPPGGVHPRPGA